MLSRAQCTVNADMVSNTLSVCMRTALVVRRATPGNMMKTSRVGKAPALIAASIESRSFAIASSKQRMQVSKALRCRNMSHHLRTLSVSP